MKVLRSRTGIIIFLALILGFFYLSPSVAPGRTKRGDVPHCQEECLGRHSERMRQLSEEYSKKANRIRYQDGVEEELSDYSRCLTECREIIPVK